MEVNASAKHKHTGPYPHDWLPVTLDDLFEFQNGVNADKADYGAGTQFINVLEVITHAHIREADIPGRVRLSEARQRSYAVQRGDVVFNRTSETQEEVGLAAVYEGDTPVVFGGFVIRGRRKSTAIDGRYAGYALRAHDVRRQIIAAGQGGIRANIGQGDLRKVVVHLPPVPEQQAIAQALSNADGLIQSLKRLIAKKRGLKQAAMQQLLTGQTRLPGFSGEWQVRTLGSLGKCHRGVSYEPNRDLSPFETSGTLRLLRSNNVQNARMVFEDMQYVSAVRVSEVQRLRPKDVLICMANGSRALVGKAAVFPDAADAAYTFGAFMGCFRPTPGLAESRFVFLLFQTEAYRKHIDLLLAGSSINNLRPSSIEALAVPIPPTSLEQAAIAEVITDMDAEITALEARLSKTRDLKQGMMQELLTGRTRLV